MKNSFVELCLIIYIFNLSVEKGIFPDYMKITKVTAGDIADLSNYRPIAVLHVFLKFLNDCNDN